jgi:hypothetical protein
LALAEAAAAKVAPVAAADLVAEAETRQEPQSVAWQ